MSLIRGVIKNYLKDATNSELERATRARRRVVELAEFTEKTQTTAQQRSHDLQKRINKDKDKAVDVEGALLELKEEIEHARNEQRSEEKNHTENVLRDMHKPVKPNEVLDDDEHLRKASQAATLLESMFDEKEALCEQVRQRCLQLEEDFKQDADSEALQALQRAHDEAEQLGQKQTAFLLRKAAAISRFIREARAFVTPRNALISLLEEDLLDWLNYTAELQELVEQCQKGKFSVAFKAGRRGLVIPDAAKPALRLRNLGANDDSGTAHSREVRAMQAITDEQNRIRNAVSGLGLRPDLAEQDLYLSADAAMPRPEDRADNDITLLRELMARDFAHNQKQAPAVPSGSGSRNGPLGHVDLTVSTSTAGKLEGGRSLRAMGPQGMVGLTAEQADHFGRGMDSSFPGVALGALTGGEDSIGTLDSLAGGHSAGSLVLPAVRLARSNRSGVIEEDSSLAATHALRHLGSKVKYQLNDEIKNSGGAALVAAAATTGPSATQKGGASPSSHQLNASWGMEALRETLSVDAGASQILADAKGHLSTVGSNAVIDAVAGGNPASVQLTEVLQQQRASSPMHLVAEVADGLRNGGKPDPHNEGLAASLASTGVPQLDDNALANSFAGSGLATLLPKGRRQSQLSVSPTPQPSPSRGKTIRSAGSGDDGPTTADLTISQKALVASGITPRMIMSNEVATAASKGSQKEMLLTSLDPRAAALKIARQDNVEQLLRVQADAEIGRCVSDILARSTEDSYSREHPLSHLGRPVASGHTPMDFSDDDILRAVRSLTNDKSLNHAQQLLRAAREFVIKRAEADATVDTAADVLAAEKSGSSMVSGFGAGSPSAKSPAFNATKNSTGADSKSKTTAMAPPISSYISGIAAQVESDFVVEKITDFQAELEALRNEISDIKMETREVVAYKEDLEKDMVGTLRNEGRSKLASSLVQTGPFNSGPLGGGLRRTESQNSTPQLPSIGGNQGHVGQAGGMTVTHLSNGKDRGALLSKSGKISTLWGSAKR